MLMQSNTPIQFQTPDEFRSRIDYLEKLVCDEADLKRIVGKYGFSEKQKLQCGLNGCNSWHWHGFVIATNSGKENHCGQDCGKRIFKVSWDSLHAEFKRQEDERDRVIALQRIQDEGDDTLMRCRKLIELCTPLVGQIQSVIKDISREPALKRVFDSAVKSGGRIMGEVERSNFMVDAPSAGKRDLVLKATIEGTSSVESSTDVLRTLAHKVNAPLTELLAKELSSLTAKEVKSQLDLLREMSFSLVRAETFIDNAQRFLQPTNLQKTRLLLEQIPQRVRTDRTRRIVERLGG
jgi:hypothetical protein